MQVEKIDTFSGHRGSVYALQAGLSPEIFYSGASDGMVVEWNLQKPDLGKGIIQLPKGIFTLALDADQQHLWVSTHLDGLHVFDLRSKQEIFQFPNPEASIFSLEILDNNILAADSAGRVFVFDLRTKKILNTFQLPGGSIRKVYALGKDTLLVASADGMIRMIDLHGKVIQAVQAHEKTVFSLSFQLETQTLISVGKDAKVKKWSLWGGEITLLQELVGHIFPIHDVVFHPSNGLFATSSMDKTIKIWSSEPFKLLKVIDFARHGGHKNSVNKLYWSDYQDFLVSASDDKKISVWKLNS